MTTALAAGQGGAIPRSVELLHRATLLASEAESFEAALQGCLEVVCELTGWPVGHVFLPDEERQRLVSSRIWRMPGEADFAPFRAATEAAAFERGQGLPGRIWESGEPLWIRDVQADPRFVRRGGPTDDAPIRGSLGFPIRIAGVTVAVLEFFTLDEIEPNEDLLLVIRTVAAQAGRVIERRHAHLALRDSEERFRATFNQTAIGMAQADLDGRILLVNDRYCEITGYSRRELLQRRFLDYTQPEDVPRTQALFQRLVAGDLPSYQVEKRYVRRDGSVVWVRVTASLVRSGTGEPKYAVGAVEDVTARKRVEQALRDSEERFRSLCACSPVGIFMTDVRGRCNYVNPRFREICGLAFEQAVGGGWMHFLHPEDRERIAAAWEQAADEGRPFADAFRFLAPDGTVRSVEACTSPIRSDQGALIGHVGTLEDVSGRRLAEEAQRALNAELHRRNREMEQFVYTVSHDLKSPLVTMLGFVGLLREDLAQGRLAEIVDSTERLERAARRMSALLDDLLQLSRVGRVQYRLEEVNVSELVRELGEQFTPRLREAGAALEIQPDLPRAVADPSRLIEVFENLLSNAVKYGCRGPHPRIEVGADAGRSGVRYFVRDNGPGIAPQHHEKIFGLFQRLETKQEGTGVGLAIVERILAAHGGRAWVESDVGQGATFWIELPLVSEGRRAPATRDGHSRPT